MKHSLRLLSLVVFALFFAPNARAQVASITVVVDGLGCPFCVYGIEKKLGQVDGVLGVHINLKTGRARLDLKPGASPKLQALKTAVEKAGFTPRAFELTAIGTILQEKKEVFSLSLRDSAERFLLFAPGVGGQQELDAKTKKQLSELAKSKTLVAITGNVHERKGSSSSLSTKGIEALHKVELLVEGMSCTKCSARLNALLRKADSVYRASVDLEKKRATIESIGKKLKPSSLIAIIEGAGFTAREAASSGGK